MAKLETKIRRCAVYTRKSSEDGLEQEFNSLHAQRDACEAFIRSQVGEGWKLVPTAYDDGGISGGTMDRLGLKALMADIAMGIIDTVVVYKVDRLTRSLADFAKMVDVFDRHEVSFVAVTQQFNTTTSMGRLTLNILLSFAQFEREVIGERVRDKIAASKRKGMWMGGMPPLGYDGDGRTLAINQPEAETVRTIFRLYGELESIQKTKRELDRRGIVSKARATQDGRIFGSKPIGTGNLHEMLKNPVYIGQIRHKGVCHAGLHEPIIDQALWEETQAKLDRNRQGRKERRISKDHAALLNKIFDENGDRLVPTHAQKQGRRYRYYVSHFLINRDPNETRKGWRIPAPALESAVISAILRLSNDPTALADAWQQADLPITKFHGFLDAIRSAPILQPLQLLERLEVSSSGLTMTISWAALIKDGPTLTHHVAMVVRQRGIEMRMVLDNERRAIDPVLLSAVVRGHKWFGELARNEVASMVEIGQRDGVSAGRVNQLTKLAFLSPKIVQAIIDGRQPADLTTKTFSRIQNLPIDWSDQEALFGL